MSEILAGNRLALSRLLTQIENDSAAGREMLNALFPHTGQAHLVGVTGAPGTGKSALVNRLVHEFRNPANGSEPSKVAVIAVDPSSPFSGGAILGDRIRMQDWAGDPGVFIRSMASRGALGGLARTTSGLAQAFDAAGYEAIFIETVGAGQVEVDIASLAHTTLVVEAPGLGDDIQAIKAGILEIADILVVNKFDRPGAEQTLRALRQMLKLAHPSAGHDLHHGQWVAVQPSDKGAPGQNMSLVGRGVAGQDHDLWFPPVLATIAIEGQGVPELAENIRAHLRYLKETGLWERCERNRLAAELDLRLRQSLLDRWRSRISEQEYLRTLDQLAARQLSPFEAVEGLLSVGGVR